MNKNDIDGRVVRLRLGDGSTYSTPLLYMARQIMALWACGISVKGARVIGGER